MAMCLICGKWDKLLESKSLLWEYADRKVERKAAKYGNGVLWIAQIVFCCNDDEKSI